MTQHRYLLVEDVLHDLALERSFVTLLESEGLIQIKLTAEGEAVLSAGDVERLRIARLLTSELDVNLPGVEVVVHMREEMLAMHRQFAEILDAMVRELHRQLRR